MLSETHVCATCEKWNPTKNENNEFFLLCPRSFPRLPPLTTRPPNQCGRNPIATILSVCIAGTTRIYRFTRFRFSAAFLFINLYKPAPNYFLPVDCLFCLGRRSFRRSMNFMIIIIRATYCKLPATTHQKVCLFVVVVMDHAIYMAGCMCAITRPFVPHTAKLGTNFYSIVGHCVRRELSLRFIKAKRHHLECENFLTAEKTLDKKM